MNRLVRSLNSFWRRSVSSGLGQDVDIPAGQLRGEADVLAAAADGQRQLLVRNHHFDAFGIFVENDLGDFRRLQGVDDERSPGPATTE